MFALESYSRNASTFGRMGNMTLESLLIDGCKVVDGWYPYGQWDAIRSPLFALGASNPPPFISRSLGGGGKAVWRYGPLWTGTGGVLSPYLIAQSLILLSCPLILAFFLGREWDRLRRWEGKSAGAPSSSR